MKFSLFVLSLVWSVSTFAVPSFDCAKAHSKVEILICENESLASLDSQIAKAYQQALPTSSNSNLFRVEQRTWLKETRNACEDALCLEVAMSQRLAELLPPPVIEETRVYRENSYKTALPVAEPVPSVERSAVKPEAPADQPKVTSQETAKKVQKAGGDQAQPFWTETVIFWTVVGLGVAMFLLAIGIKEHANYFHDWFDFVISTALTLVIFGYIPDILVALAIVVFSHIIIGSAINGFSFKKGLISSIGRCSAIFMLLGVVLASLIYIFTKQKTSNIDNRISSGESPMQAHENDRKANNRQMLGIAVGAGATGGVLYWIGSHFIDNAAKP